MVTLEQLDQVEAFKNLNNEQLKRIQKFATKETYSLGDKLFTEGDPAQHLWVVLQGRVDLRFELPGGRPATEDHTISTHDAGDNDPKKKVFGWSCFIPPYRMRLSAYCVSRSCEVIKIPREKLLELFEEDPQMGYKVLSYLIKVVGYRFHQFQEEVSKQRGHYIMHSW